MYDVLLQDEYGHTITLSVTATTSYTAEGRAVKLAAREYPGRDWRPIYSLPVGAIEHV